jgi:hypothetical protein
MDKSIAVSPVVTREAKTWRLRVNAITRRAHCRFGSRRFEVPLTWSTDDRLPGERFAPKGAWKENLS